MDASVRKKLINQIEARCFDGKYIRESSSIRPSEKQPAGGSLRQDCV